MFWLSGELGSISISLKVFSLTFSAVALRTLKLHFRISEAVISLQSTARRISYWFHVQYLIFYDVNQRRNSCFTVCCPISGHFEFTILHFAVKRKQIRTIRSKDLSTSLLSFVLLGGKIQVFVGVSKICFFLNVIFVARRIISFQLSGMFSQTVRQILIFFLYKRS